MEASSKFIDKRREFIKQFDDLVPTTGSQHVIKSLAEQYKISLDNLSSYREELINLFSLGKVDPEKLAKKSKYPTGISVFHHVMGGILGATILTGLSLAFSYIYGGTNTEAWSTSLQWISVGIGALPGIGAAVGTIATNKKRFDADKVQKQSDFLNLEKLILTRSREITAARNILAFDIEQNMDKILEGKFSFKEEVVSYKNGKRISKIKFKPEYDKLQPHVKHKLSNLTKKISRNSDLLSEIYEKLYIHTKNAQEEAAKTIKTKVKHNKPIERVSTLPGKNNGKQIIETSDRNKPPRHVQKRKKNNNGQKNVSRH